MSEMAAALGHDPAVTVHLEDGEQTVILRDEAEQIIGPSRGLVEHPAEAIPTNTRTWVIHRN
jgi:hypothetical protein